MYAVTMGIFLPVIAEMSAQCKAVKAPMEADLSPA